MLYNVAVYQKLREGEREKGKESGEIIMWWEEGG